MRALRLHGIGDIRVEDVPEPRITRPDQVKLTVAYAGICGSDLHNYKTGMWISRTPTIPGHEFAAMVVETGDGVEDLAVGDHVVADSRMTCGTCAPCRSGRRQFCADLGFVGEVNDGGFAEFTVQPARVLKRLPDLDFPLDVAALAEPLAVAIHALNRLDAGPGDRVLVAGAGIIGALCALILKHRGQEEVAVADLNRARLERAVEVARATAYDLSRPRAAAPIDAAPIDAAPIDAAPIDAAIDATGSPAVVNSILHLLPGGSRLALVGLAHGPSTIDLNAIVEKGIDLRGCAAFNDELGTAIGLLGPLRTDLEKLISRPVELARAKEKFIELSEGKSTETKVILSCRS